MYSEPRSGWNGNLFWAGPEGAARIAAPALENVVMPRQRLIVFDFDGVIADSEIVANAVLAEFLTELGTPTTTEDSLEHFMGKRIDDVIAAIDAATGRPSEGGMAAELTRRTLSRFRTELREIPGVRSYLAAFAHLPRCIASSSSPDRLAACIDMLALGEHFGSHVYSASHVARGKPHPDIFLHAARQVGVDPSNAIVIEDSEGGVRAAVAAGMTAIGFCAASHVRPGHGKRLRAAGAHYVAHTYQEAQDITRTLVD